MNPRLPRNPFGGAQEPRASRPRGRTNQQRAQIEEAFQTHVHPRFSQVLQRRRQELRLSTGQASRNLRLKEEVLLAFEEGDWSRIPRSGYAQGMLSSYARYLGLNPSEIILLFQEDFDAYSRGGYSSGAKNPEQKRPSNRLRISRGGDLYGSQGPAGSMLSGSIEDAKIYGEQNSGRASAIPGSAEYGYSQKYLNQSNRHPQEDSSYTHRNLYTKSTSDTVRRNRRQSQGPIRDEYARYSLQEQTDGRFQTGEITTRQIQAQMFSDDLHYDPARPYEQASTAAGRRASKNIVRPERPNVQRRSAQSVPPQDSQNSDQKQKPFFSNTKRTIVIAFLVVAAILLVLITLGIRSCASKMQENNQPTEIANPQQQDTQPETPAQNTNNQYVEVKVEVLQGNVTWLEVKNDNVADVAQTVTGPWSKTYQVTGTMQVKAAEAAAVKITANGQTVSFDKSSAGLSVATINAKDYGVVPAQNAAPNASANASNNTSSDKKKSTDTNKNANSGATSGSASSGSSGKKK